MIFFIIILQMKRRSVYFPLFCRSSRVEELVFLLLNLKIIKKDMHTAAAIHFFIKEKQIE